MNKSKKILMSVLLTASLAIPTAGASAATQNTDNGAEKFRVYVESNNLYQKDMLMKQYDARWELTENGFSTDMTQQQFEALQKNKNLKLTKVQEVKLDTDVRATQSQVQAAEYPTHQTPWGIKAIYNNSSQTTTSGGAGINIAVLDTGVYTAHYDLENTVEQCKDFTQATSLVNGACNDAHGHGTHVAGSALADGGDDGAGIYGVAPQADLWAYKVLGDNGSGYSDDIAAAIRHAADQATSTGTKTVINMSLGSAGNDSLISSAVTYAYNKGVLVVAAAGNEGPSQGSIGYPGALVNAVAVAALENVQQNGTYRVADFSSRGYASTDGDYVIQQGDVEISAPGAAIYSTWNNGGYNTISGTSMASPHAAGLAAKLWASNPSWSNASLRANLQNRAKTYDIKGGYGATTGDDYASGFGFARVK
ncbi:S8 family serine peptidase [Paenisporosarcina quisquiliarum]|uniref:S8 family serine peptidase n=1 Tax=Paenisporosarcina quisquiliarum TaxID=365346 RepID=A0A9X3LH45_9BACL|nr:S8 family serine peptidase [Paenisporosarcina quisquiliarum]MCZ8537295.1 S8 family serine peptidase [Paenisporosarcina quisquiliarum]